MVDRSLMDLAKGRLVPAEGPVIAALKLTLDFQMLVGTGVNTTDGGGRGIPKRARNGQASRFVTSGQGVERMLLVCTWP